MSYRNRQASIVKSNFAKKTENQRPRSRVMEVTGYDTRANIIFGKDIKTDDQIEFRIDPAKFAELESKRKQREAQGDEKPVYYPHKIDDSFAKNVPVGSWVVLEGAVVTKVLGEKKVEVQGDYVHNASDTNTDKVIAGPYTLQIGENHRAEFALAFGRDYGRYDFRGIIANSKNEADVAILDEFANLLDKIAEERTSKQKGSYAVGYGMRALVPRADERGRKFYQVVHAVQPIEWIRAVRDAQGATVTPGRPVDGGDLLGATDQTTNQAVPGDIENYESYLFGTDAEPGYLAKAGFSQEDIAATVVEIVPVRKFKASDKHRTFALPENTKAPIHRMISGAVREAIGEEPSWFANFIAVDGILEITANKLVPNPENKKENIEIIQSLAARATFGGYMGHVYSMVRAYDGAVCRMHPELAPQKEARLEEAAAPASGDAPADDDTGGLNLGGSSNAYAAALGDAAGSDNPFGEDENLFGDAPAAAAPAAATPAPAAAATTAAAPAATGGRRRGVT